MQVYKKADSFRRPLEFIMCRSNHCLSRFHDVVRTKSELFEQLYSGAGVAELVVHADLYYLSRAGLSQHVAYSRAESADNAVLLDRQNLAGLCGGRGDDLLVYRLDEC